MTTIYLKKLSYTAKKLLCDRKGQFLPGAMIAMLILIGALGFTLDLSGAFLTRAKLNTSLDAAAHAGALSGRKYIEAKCTGGKWETRYRWVTDPDGSRHRESYEVWVDKSKTYSGLESEFEKWYDSWRRGLDRYSYTISKRWAQFDSNYDDQAEAVFYINAANLGLADTDVSISKKDGKSARPASVTADGEAYFYTSILRNFGIDRIKTESSATYIFQFPKP